MPAIIIMLIGMLLLTGCGPSGPTDADMAGCAVRSGGPPISYREVADCAADRASSRAESARETDREIKRSAPPAP